jgi:hypothetical protein
MTTQTTSSHLSKFEFPLSSHTSVWLFFFFVLRVSGEIHSHCQHTGMRVPALHVFYRLSDAAQASVDGRPSYKAKPAYINNRTCLLNFIACFGSARVTVVADRVCDATHDWLRSLLPHDRVIRTDHGNGAATFLCAVHLAADLPDATPVLLCEDDYLYTPDAKSVLLEGLELADYVTLYDHPDKYVSAEECRYGVVGNPLITDASEVTRVYISDSSHWKLTNSTTMSFATTVKCLKADASIYNQYCSTGYPHDYAMFRHLITQKSRRLISPIPGRSTHGETLLLAPFIDWEAVVQASHICRSRGV